MGGSFLILGRVDTGLPPRGKYRISHFRHCKCTTIIEYATQTKKFFCGLIVEDLL